jgi:hypothetical protein
MTDEPGWALRYLEEHWQETMEWFMNPVNMNVADNYELDESCEKTYLEACGLKPTPDAIAQLRDAFLPALQIMCERGYDPDGQTWKGKGWRNLVRDIMNKSERLRFHSWTNSRFDKDSAIDLINYCGFYVRLENQGEPWGTWGAPGGDA